MSVKRENWFHRVQEVNRSRHYTWLAQGLGGEDAEEAMTWLTTDIMHLCEMAAIPFDRVLNHARFHHHVEQDELYETATAGDRET